MLKLIAFPWTVSSMAWPLGVRHVEMPATPERLWRAIQAHRLQAAAE